MYDIGLFTAKPMFYYTRYNNSYCGFRFTFLIMIFEIRKSWKTIYYIILWSLPVYFTIFLGIKFERIKEKRFCKYSVLIVILSWYSLLIFNIHYGRSTYL